MSSSWLEDIKAKEGIVSVPLEVSHHRHGDFLQSLSSDPMTRNSLLAWHDVHSQRAHYEHFMDKYYKAERSQQSQVNTFTEDHSHSSRQNKKRKRSGADASDPTIIATAGSYEVSLYEPEVLRLSFYQKLTYHLQHFYNEQDVMSIESLLLIPLCDPTVIKTLNFWTNKDKSPSLDIEAEKMMLCPQQRSRYYKPLMAVSLEGSQGIVEACVHIFETLPDCVIVYHPVTVIHPDDNMVDEHESDFKIKGEIDTKSETTNDSGNDTEEDLSSISMVGSNNGEHQPPVSNREGTLVKAPYSYFFKVPLSVIVTEAATPTTITSSPVFVDIELQGCVELVYSSHNHMITRLYDHFTISSTCLLLLTTLFPSFSMERLLQYMGYPPSTTI